MHYLNNRYIKILFRFGLVLYPFLLAIYKLILGILTPSIFLCFYALYDIGIGLAKENTQRSACLAGLFFGGFSAMIALYMIISTRKKFRVNILVFNMNEAHNLVKRSIIDFVNIIRSTKK